MVKFTSILLLLVFFTFRILAQGPEVEIGSGTTNVSLRQSIVLNSTVRIQAFTTVGTVATGVDLTNANISNFVSLIDEGDVPVSLTNVRINDEFNRITLSPQNLLLPEKTYTIRLDSVRNLDSPTDILPASEYTFTTGKTVTVNNAVTNNICAGDPAGAVLDTIKIFENIADNFINLETKNNIS